jgi:hypothetical protein
MERAMCYAAWYFGALRKRHEELSDAEIEYKIDRGDDKSDEARKHDSEVITRVQKVILLVFRS